MKAIVLPILVTGALVASIFAPVVLEQKTKVLSDNSRLTYNVNDKKELEGAYFVENTKRDVWIRGSYKGDQRAGNWYTFNNDKSIFLRYNYDLKKLLYLDTVAIKKAEISITDKNPEAAKNGSIPLPICSIDQYVSLMGELAKSTFPKEQITYNKPFDATITAKVKSRTDVTYSIEYSFNGFKYAYPISTKKLDFDIDWIPSTYNGKDVEAEFKVATQLVFYPSDGKQRFIWNY